MMMNMFVTSRLVGAREFRQVVRQQSSTTSFAAQSGFFNRVRTSERTAATPTWNCRNLAVRPFHGTPSLALSFRRRRRSMDMPPVDQHDEADEDDDEAKGPTLAHVPVRDQSRFEEASSSLLIKVEQALQPMKKVNDPFILSRSRDEDGNEVLHLDLGPMHGEYALTVNLSEKNVALLSPISGIHNYILSSKTGEWVGEQDGHALEGLLVRDLIRQCHGLPNL